MPGYCIRTTVTVVLLTFTFTTPAQASETTYDDVRSWLAEYAYAPTDGVREGTYTIDDLAKLRPYLPPGFASQFDFPELIVEIMETQHYVPSRAYQMATEQFAGTARIGADGKLESHTVGRPFSAAQIDAAELAQAGYMVAWNHIFRWQNYGYSAKSLVSYVRPGSGGTQTAGMAGGGSATRSMTVDYRRVYLAKLAQEADEDYRFDIGDKGDLYWKESYEFIEPFDVAGSKFVVERSLDPEVGDQVFSYIAGERRVRRLSAKERADSFMGTDLTLDDSQGFSGRVLDYSWNYLGRKVVMHVSASRNAQAEFFGPSSNIPLDRWQLRPCYVVELTPKWEEHPYGRRVQFIDAESFNTALSLIFDRSDSLWKVIYTAYEHADLALGTEPTLEESVHRWSALVGIDLDKSTTTLIREAPGVQARYVKDTAAKVRRIFDISDLTKGR